MFTWVTGYLAVGLKQHHLNVKVLKASLVHSLDRQLDTGELLSVVAHSPLRQ